MTAVNVLHSCTRFNAQLPVPQSLEDSHFLTSIGNTYLGIRGKFENQFVNWTNIYTNEEQKYFEWYKEFELTNNPSFHHRLVQLGNGKWFPAHTTTKNAVMCVTKGN